MSTLVFIVLIMGLMWFMLIRPQTKQAKEHRAMLATLKKGDDVVTQGGIIGRVFAVTDKVITVEVANGVKVRVMKTSIQGKAGVLEENGTKADAAKADEKAEEKGEK